MDKVERFTPGVRTTGQAMTADPNGGFVMFADYDTLRQQLAATIAERNEDMENVGLALMETLRRNCPEYSWNDSPTEIVVDLLNDKQEAIVERDRAVKLLRRVHHDLLAGSRIDVQTCYAIAAFVDAALAAAAGDAGGES